MSAELTLGPLARELGPRCLGGGADSLRFELSPKASPDLLAEIRGWSGVSWEPGLSIPHETLARRAEESEVAACLRAAAQARGAPPARPELMGIVNVTPDSFSDGGRFLDPAAARDHATELSRQGAAWLDVGGESTRPGADPVGELEELERVLPVLAALREDTRARLSVDTRKAQVAAAALELGVDMVNDVGAGLDDEAMLATVAGSEAAYCLMHRQGSIRDMQRAPSYTDPVAEVTEFLRERAAACLAAGIQAERIYVDPGIGFGKTLEHNLELLRRLSELRSLGLPLLVGVSRKSFIAHAVRAVPGASPSEEAPDARVGGSAAAISFCVRGGARVLRVHDVAVMAEAATVAYALETRS